MQRGYSVLGGSGITAASGCSAYSGIPLTHRDYAQSVRLITGRKTGGELDWENTAAEKQTLVFYMGLNQAATIQQKLIEHGMPGRNAGGNCRKRNSSHAARD